MNPNALPFTAKQIPPPLTRPSTNPYLSTQPTDTPPQWTTQQHQSLAPLSSLPPLQPLPYNNGRNWNQYEPIPPYTHNIVTFSSARQPSPTPARFPSPPPESFTAAEVMGGFYSQHDQYDPLAEKIHSFITNSSLAFSSISSGINNIVTTEIASLGRERLEMVETTAIQWPTTPSGIRVEGSLKVISRTYTFWYTVAGQNELEKVEWECRYDFER